MTPDLKVALQNLRDLPDQPSSEFSDGMHGEEKHAEKCIDLAASFVTALDKESGYKELDQRLTLFDNLTREGSAYNDLCTAAHESMIQLFPDAEVDRISVSPPYEEFKFRSNCLAHGFLNRSDVNTLLGDAESVLWSPHELLDFSDDLLELYDGQLLCSLLDNLDALHGRMKSRNLWGAFLLATSHKVTCAPAPDRYRKLRMAIMASKGALAAIKAAAEDLSAALPVDGERTPTKAEEHDGGDKVPEEGKLAAEKPAVASGGSPSQADGEFVSAAEIMRNAHEEGYDDVTVNYIIRIRDLPDNGQKGKGARKFRRGPAMKYIREHCSKGSPKSDVQPMAEAELPSDRIARYLKTSGPATPFIIGHTVKLEEDAVRRWLKEFPERFQENPDTSQWSLL